MTKCTTTHDENYFLDAGGVYEDKPKDSAFLFIADFESPDNAAACLQQINKTVKTRTILERSIRDSQLYQIFFTTESVQKSDKSKIDKQVTDHVLNQIKEHKGYYNYVLRTDELDEFLIESGIKQ